MKDGVAVFWFRRDLRLEDNAGLSKALASGFSVLPIFIFDPQILDPLDNKADRRVDYIHQALQAINSELNAKGSTLLTLHGNPVDIFSKLQETYTILGVFCNEDYEPQSISRDAKIRQFLNASGIPFHLFKDQVIFDPGEVLKADGSPYSIYTPFANKWKALLQPADILPYTVNYKNFYRQLAQPVPPIHAFGFQSTAIQFEQPLLSPDMIQHYDLHRDYPALQKTSRLGIAFRFGTISVRQAVAMASVYSPMWLSELIWREFFMHILFHYPEVISRAFKEKYDRIPWLDDEPSFQAWCSGHTGYPMVDAGMRQLNQTGYMHNRVRMVTASFLCKHLLIDWRWGEAYFAHKLDDYELASNNGNWQWAAGSGCDAAPYFRIFNPDSQVKKFDRNLAFIRQWIPEYGTEYYPAPIVDHQFARARALRTYKQALQEY